MNKTPLKRLINRILSVLGVRLDRIPADGLTGVDLFEDLKKIIPLESPVCLDVGANVGQTIANLMATYRSPCIHAFEPSKETFRELQSNISEKQVFLYNQALGKESSQREFINYQDSRLSSFLTLDNNDENRHRNMSERNRELVSVNTVDKFIDHQKIDTVNLLKIDTQGFDMEVLKGAQQSLRNGAIEHVLIEINFIKMYQGQGNAEETIKLLNEHGLHLIDYHEKSRENNVLTWCTALFGKK